MEHGQKLYAAKTVSWPGATPFFSRFSGPKRPTGFWGRSRPRCTRSSRAFGVLPRTRIVIATSSEIVLSVRTERNH